MVINLDLYIKIIFFLFDILVNIIRLILIN